MSASTAFTRPLKAGIAGFLVLNGVIGGLALARSLGFMGEVVEKRAVGFTIGLMLVVIGNLLPKLRPLGLIHPDPAQAAGGERFAGRVLLLAGLAYLLLFAIAPLAQARPASAIVGIAALAFVAADWIWLSRGLLSRSRRMERVAAGKRIRLTAQLVFAGFFVLAAACGKFLFGDRPWAGAFEDWSLVVFLMLYAALTAIFDHGCRTEP